MEFLARCYGFMVLVLLMVHPVQGVIPQNKSDHYYGKCEETYLLLILLSCLSLSSGHHRNSDHRLLKLAPTHQSDKEFLFGA